MHEQMILDYKDQLKQQNSLKNLQVRQQYQEGNQRIKSFFQSRQRQTQESNQIRAIEEKQRQQNLEEAMKQIEAQETQMFGQLHETLKVEQNTASELVQAKKMPPEAFLDKSSKVMRRQLSASALSQRDVYNNANNICLKQLSSFHNAANVAGRENLSNPSSKLKRIPSAFARNYYPKMF